MLVRSLLRRLLGAFLLLAAGVLPQAAAAEETEAPLPLRLERGDRVAIVGNALADRMQHAGYLETLIHADHPDHELVFRNLAAAGDEIDTWFRSDGFGSRDEWLSRVRADVILAFYGFNESTGGEAGLGAFRKELASFLNHLGAQNYSGRGAPQIVLFSPIANEHHRDPNFPDPRANNRNIAAYTEAMKEVAARHGVPFVDLLSLSSELFAQAAARDDSLTVNGLYLKDDGYRLLAPKIFRELLGTETPWANLEKLRQAVLDKNWQWHQRYRIIDAYNIHGGRSALAYLPDEPGFTYEREPPEPRISNFQVLQGELAQRDVMTANRDQRIWAVARGGDTVVDDSNLPPVRAVPTNKPAPSGTQSHPILSGEAAIDEMVLYPGLKVNLFADEAQFPGLANPVQIAWDTRGRLWVAVWPEYPGRTPTSDRGDSLLVFEDTTGDGRADKMTPFATGLNAPTGFQFYKDGVLVVQAPDLWYLRDTTGDGKADQRERLLMGLDSADSHHTANALAYDPGGAIYLSDGVFHRTQVETLHGPVRNKDGAIYRFEPATGRFETYISYDFANPHGRVFDRWGNDLVTDATGNHTYFGAAFSGRLDFEHGKHPRMKTFWDRPARPAAATALLTSRHFPEELQGNFLNLNVIAFQGIFNVAVREDGSALKGETREPLLRSEDPNFIPSDIKIGPDGAIYFSDWHNPIVGHMQHHLRDPSRDNRHGRIYRLTCEDRPLLEPPPIHGAPIPALLELLREPEDHVRQLAKIELARHDSDEVVAAVRERIHKLDTNDPDFEHHMMEALWVHQWHNVVEVDLLDRMLESPEPRARAAAGRVLCYWRDRVPGALDRFMKLARDEHPRVRLEAVRGASFFREAKATAVALTVLEKPMDYYLDYSLTETLRQLGPYWRSAMREGVPLGLDPAALERLRALLAEDETENQASPPAPVAKAEYTPGEKNEAVVRSFVIRAVPQQMRFDTRRIVVEAGRPFEIVFENPDLMPHNLVVVQPGARRIVGPLADRMRPEQKDAEGRAYVPDRPEVLAATHMLDTGESEALQIIAPEKEGIYEFLCSFPGHWAVMGGELVVTHDVDAYPATEPPAQPAPTSHDGRH